MAKKTGLGRGLAALLGENTDDAVETHRAAHLASESFVAANEAKPAASHAVAGRASSGPQGIVDIPVNLIRRNPRQPRRAIDSEALEELAASISAVGIVQPVIVRKIDEGYELIAGERRWLAAQKAGFTIIPAIIRAASDVESLELALIENVVRQQLNPVDEAFALKVLLEDLGVTQESLAKRIGKSRSAIANKMRLLDLPAAIQELLASGALTEGHGRALLGLSERGKQLQLARRAVDKQLSVRQVEDEVRRNAETPGKVRPRKSSTISQVTCDEVADAVYGLLGVVPRVKLRGEGGVIEVPFKDEKALQEMLDRLRAE